MVEAILAQNLAHILAPALPYLMKSAVAAGKDAAKKALGDKFIEDTWNKATSIWKILLPEVENKPEVAKELKEIVEKGADPRAEIILSWQLEKLDLSSEKLIELKNIVAERNTNKIVSANNGGVAYGDNAKGNIAVTGASGNITIPSPQSTEKKN